MFSRLSQEGGRLHWLLLVLFSGSGCAALIYEVVWFHLLRFVIGASAVSLGILLASFMGGMCLGSLLFHRFCPTRIHPLRVYASLELGIGLFGILLPLLIPLASRIYNPWAGYGYFNILLRSLICVLLLLAPTALMGATLPAISRWMEATRIGMARLGFFYGANIAGAVAGVLLAGFYLLRFFDIYVATAVAASLNLGIGLLGWWLSLRAEAKIPDPEKASRVEYFQPASRPVFIVIALSGLTALGAQVVWTRLLSLLFGGTVYTFSVILSVFLTGLGIGSVVGARLSKSVRSPVVTLGMVQLLLVLAIPFSAFAIMDWIPGLHFLDFQSGWQEKSLDDLLRCALSILPGTVLWGASFPLALAAVASGDSDPGKPVGRVYAANTVGAILGALFFSSVSIPSIGSRASQQLLTILAALAAALILVGKSAREAGKRPRKNQKPSPASLHPLLSRGIPILLLTLLTSGTLPRLHPGMIGFGRDVPQWDAVEFIHTSEGINASIAVSNEDGYRNFHVSGKVVASNLPQDMRLQRMLGHIPALLHPNPKNVLVVGFGAGVTAGTFSLYPEIRRIVIVEIEPEVPKASGVYFRDENYDVLNDPRTVLIHDDARHFVATTEETFDIITADPIHPWVKGAAALYTMEFFELCKKHLNPGGFLTQWVPFYETNEKAVKSEIRTIFQAFPYATIWNSDEGIVGYDVTILAQQERLQIDADFIDARLRSNPRVRRSLAEVNLFSALGLLKTFAGNRSQIADWLADGQLNLDRNLRLEYLAGQANNTWMESEIYSHMTRNLRYPEGLLRVRPSAERVLRSWFEQIY